MSIMVEIYYVVMLCLAFDLVYTTCIKPRLFPPRRRRFILRRFIPRRTENPDSDNDAYSSKSSSTISIALLFRSSLSSLSDGPDYESGVMGNEEPRLFLENKQELGSVHQPGKLELPGAKRTESSLEGFERPVCCIRRCRSWPVLTIKDRGFEGSFLLRALNISMFNLHRLVESMNVISPAMSLTSSNTSFYTSKSSIPQLTTARSFPFSPFLPPGSRSLSSLSGSSAGLLCGKNFEGELALSTQASSSSRSSVSEYSEGFAWTVYDYPVPASITSSDPFQYQLRRSQQEYIFVRRPFHLLLPAVCDWLRDNFFPVRGEESSGDDGDDYNATRGGGSKDQLADAPGPSGMMMYGTRFWVSEDRFRSGGTSYDTRRGLSSEDPSYLCVSQLSQSNHSIPSVKRDTPYLVNNIKTEVIMCGYPGAKPNTVHLRPWGSMTELHHRRNLRSRVHFSLPNIFEEFGFKNGVAFHVQNLESFAVKIDSHSYDERKYIITEDTSDSISVVMERVERRDQMLRDAARAKMEQNRERRRRLRMFREHEEVEAIRPRPVQVPPLSFVDIFKHEAYKQVFIPFLFHTGKELLLSAIT
ncbi:uncharacterized protein LOC114528611 [Dendronephthya gigantea]|uniref:uncharacterized protein LOC114528611 n=1 Tax=Dendronephthya gigantea TaxID=151771 RepID=UPI00106AE8C4|nr:uncharacterized protein LOC114528611 [Dendronephthya gigantea]